MHSHAFDKKAQLNYKVRFELSTSCGSLSARVYSQGLESQEVVLMVQAENRVDCQRKMATVARCQHVSA